MSESRPLPRRLRRLRARRARRSSEAAALRAHLESCVVCRDEVARLAPSPTRSRAAFRRCAAPPSCAARVIDAVEAEAAPFSRRAPGRPRPAPAACRPPCARPRRSRRARARLGVALGGSCRPGGTPATPVVSASVAPASSWGAGARRSRRCARPAATPSSSSAHAGRAAGQGLRGLGQAGGERSATDALFDADLGRRRATVAVPPTCAAPSACSSPPSGSAAAQARRRWRR